VAKTDLTVERLRELLSYDSETGAFAWREHRANVLAGSSAGWVDQRGYIRISIDDSDYFAHHLAWMCCYGYRPAAKEIEWANGDMLDNRIANLRKRVRREHVEMTQQLAQDALSYDADSGVFRWKVSRCNSVPAGSVAGAIGPDGYVRIKIGLRSWAAHRLVWMYVYGRWPVNHIDHINGVCSDNRLCNLRDVTRSENNSNQKSAHAGSKTGFLGVFVNGRKFGAKIQVNKKTIPLGNFATPQEAHAAYLAAKRTLHSTCTI
jgi:hypothetical protein